MVGEEAGVISHPNKPHPELTSSDCRGEDNGRSGVCMDGAVGATVGATAVVVVALGLFEVAGEAKFNPCCGGNTVSSASLTTAGDLLVVKDRVAIGLNTVMHSITSPFTARCSIRSRGSQDKAGETYLSHIHSF
jgi:hypothetical protein